MKIQDLFNVDADFVAHQATTIVGSSFITLQVHAGYGRHVYYLSKFQKVETLKWTTASEIQNVIGVCFVKISVCFFVLRMIEGTNNAIRRIFVSFMTILSVLMVANVLLLCLQCIPIQGIWDSEIPAHCIAPSNVDNISKAFSGMLRPTKGNSCDLCSGSFRCGYRFSLCVVAIIRSPWAEDESKN